MLFLVWRVPHARPYTPLCSFFFFFNDTATTEIYTLSLHDALPISKFGLRPLRRTSSRPINKWHSRLSRSADIRRSEEHTSELQSQSNLVCRLLLEKKNKRTESACDRETTPTTYGSLSSITSRMNAT